MTTPHAIAWRYCALTAALLLTSTTAAHAAFIPLTATLTGTQEVAPHAAPAPGAAAGRRGAGAQAAEPGRDLRGGRPPAAARLDRRTRAAR